MNRGFIIGAGEEVDDVAGIDDLWTYQGSISNRIHKACDNCRNICLREVGEWVDGRTRAFST